MNTLARKILLQGLAILLPLLLAPTAPAQFLAEERVAKERVVYRDHVVLRHGDDGEDHVILWLADGTLVTAPRSQTAPSDARFQPKSAEQIGAALLKKPALAGMQAYTTNHYTVVSDATPQFRKTATRILESMLAGIVKHIRAMKVPIHAPPTSMPVVMFRQRSRYLAYRQVPDQIIAYYEPISNQVVMCEEAPGGGPDASIIRSQRLATIAHEGAHQILHNVGVQQRLAHWPAWLNEGLAEYFAPTTFGKRMTWKGAGEVNDWRMYELERYLKSGAGEGEFVNDTVLASRLTSTGYATAWALTHYLAEYRREAFHTLVRHYTKTDPLEGSRRQASSIDLSQRIAFARHLGSDFAAMEGKIVAHLRTLPYRDPYASEPHFVGFALWLAPPKKLADVFHNRRDAERWCRDHGQQVKTVVRQFETRRQAEAFARQWLGK